MRFFDPRFAELHRHLDRRMDGSDALASGTTQTVSAAAGSFEGLARAVDALGHRLGGFDAKLDTDLETISELSLTLRRSSQMLSEPLSQLRHALDRLGSSPAGGPSPAWTVLWSYAAAAAWRLPPASTVMILGDSGPLAALMSALGHGITVLSGAPDDWETPGTPPRAIFVATGADGVPGATFDRLTTERFREWLPSGGELILCAGPSTEDYEDLLKGWEILDRRFCASSGGLSLKVSGGVPDQGRIDEAGPAGVMIIATPE